MRIHNNEFARDSMEQFDALVAAAQDFCLIIDHVEHYQNGQWLWDMSRLLARIQVAMTCLDNPDLECVYFALPDLEHRFELYCRLKDKLGQLDGYWLEYDSHTEEDMSGSLAGDLTDIYFELKRGLGFHQSEQGNQAHVLKIWQTGYLIHWGQHLLEAQKHLFYLRANNYLPENLPSQ